jgi:hypothetical protein
MQRQMCEYLHASWYGNYHFPITFEVNLVMTFFLHLRPSDPSIYPLQNIWSVPFPLLIYIFVLTIADGNLNKGRNIDMKHI